MTELTPEALRQTIENTRRQLAATPGLTPEMIAQMLAPLQSQLVALEQSQPARAVFAQQQQTVTTQFNVAHLYQIYQTAPGTPKLSQAEVRRTVKRT